VRRFVVLAALGVTLPAALGLAQTRAESPTCAATTVRYGPAKHPTLGDRPWVLARPQTAAVLGFLQNYRRTLRDGRVNDADGLVLWQTGETIVWSLPRGTPTLVARRLDAPGTVRISLRRTPAGFASAPRFPSAGCWLLTLGGASVTAQVVPRPARPGCDATISPPTGLTLVRPRSAGIAGGFTWRTDDGRLLLYTHGIGPGDLNAKVLWWSRRAHGALDLTGTGLDRSGSFHESWTEAGTSQLAPGYVAAFPSNVDVPAPGCWLLRLRVGRDAGVLVVRARNR
jgi:hypothetical protein